MFAVQYWNGLGWAIIRVRLEKCQGSKLRLLFKSFPGPLLKLGMAKMVKNWLMEKHCNSNNFHLFGGVEVSKFKFVNALSEFRNILPMEQKAFVWYFIRQV